MRSVGLWLIDYTTWAPLTNESNDETAAEGTERKQKRQAACGTVHIAQEAFEGSLRNNGNQPLIRKLTSRLGKRPPIEQFSVSDWGKTGKRFGEGVLLGRLF